VVLQYAFRGSPKNSLVKGTNVAVDRNPIAGRIAVVNSTKTWLSSGIMFMAGKMAFM